MTEIKNKKTEFIEELSCYECGKKMIKEDDKYKCKGCRIEVTSKQLK